MIVEETREVWQENFEQANKHLKIADHMAYVTFSLLKDFHLLGKILSELAISARFFISGLLQYEYSRKQIPLYQDPKLNFKTFKEKIAPRYFSREDFDILVKILEIEQKHKKSAMEFVKKEKFVIMNNDKYETLTIEKIKGFLNVIKRVFGVFEKSVNTTK